MLKYLANLSAQKSVLSRTQKRAFAGSLVGTLATFVIQSLHGPLDRQSCFVYVCDMHAVLAVLGCVCVCGFLD